MLLTIAICISLIWTMLGEYAAHRWIMHSYSIFGKTKFWREHAVEHHAKKRNDVNIDLNPQTSFALGLPLLIFCFWLGPWWITGLIILACLHAYSWSILHATYHNVGKTQWVKNFWYYKKWERHHLYHHDHPRKNYGAVFIWTDYLFGTKG